MQRLFKPLVIAKGHVRAFVTNTTFESEKYITHSQKNGVRTITLSHGASRNSLSLQMMQVLLWQIKRDETNESLRSIVIDAQPGKVFSAGHNLKELTSSKGSDYHHEVFSTAAELMKAISDSPVPVIAAVDGLAAAAGCQLVAACDIVLCTSRSCFSTPGANFGVFCSTPGIPLVRNVPRKVASHMLFTGLPLSAQEAYAAGLVSKIVPDDELGLEIRKTTDAINSKSRSVVQLGKKFLNEQLEIDLMSAYTFGTEIMLRNLELNDAQEGCKAMAVVPQGAFLARKFREMKERQFMIMEMNDSEERDRENRRRGNCGGDGTWYNKNSTEGRELTPVKYNSKLMNSIWGLYNRYSPHNFKKNTDANQRMIAPIWERALLSAVALLPQLRRQSKS